MHLSALSCSIQGFLTDLERDHRFPGALSCKRLPGLHLRFKDSSKWLIDCVSLAFRIPLLLMKSFHLGLCDWVTNS